MAIEVLRTLGALDILIELLGVYKTPSKNHEIKCSV
uniref:Transcriptional regulator n=1 Tax=Meloidogyne hapla TaxID=6305 RepID=A0A1I8BZB6_MELHA